LLILFFFCFWFPLLLTLQKQRKQKQKTKKKIRRTEGPTSARSLTAFAQLYFCALFLFLFPLLLTLQKQPLPCAASKLKLTPMGGGLLAKCKQKLKNKNKEAALSRGGHQGPRGSRQEWGDGCSGCCGGGFERRGKDFCYKVNLGLPWLKAPTLAQQPLASSGLSPEGKGCEARVFIFIF
jgi:hypothetical protein